MSLFCHPIFLLIKRALINFRANNGILLSGAIAYYTLLSIIPLFTLLLTGLSNFLNEEQLLDIVNNNLSLIIGTQSNILTEQIATFVEHRQTVSWIGVLALFFFSSTAFTVLENTLSVIFSDRIKQQRRHFLVSAIIPYIYIFLLGISILVIILIHSAVDLLEDNYLTLFIWTWYLNDFTGIFLYFLGLIGLILLLASFYMVMPIGKISFRHALVGSLSVVIFWEIIRHILIWYISNFSIINIIYGSLATAVVALVFLEIAAMNFLFGAQLIAEYERFDIESAKVAECDTKP
jgi:YihY family inner membrane protein